MVHAPRPFIKSPERSSPYQQITLSTLSLSLNALDLLPIFISGAKEEVGLNQARPKCCLLIVCIEHAWTIFGPEPVLKREDTTAEPFLLVEHGSSPVLKREHGYCIK
uniref:Uncharacterized protein n=1 Tax=Picea glauca TaxID=3330 RepID=A0A101M2R5_PICGL|nr:hypothetical protein ABT39_MTgene3012 [Picea glauca]